MTIKPTLLRDCLFYILFSTALYSKNDATEHIRIAIALEQKILPIPTRGETIPPKKNGTKPDRADALPARSRSKLMAKAPPTGKIKPNPKRSKKKPISTKINGSVRVRTMAK